MFTIIVFTFVYTLLIGCIDEMMVDKLGKEEREGGQRIPLLAKKLTKLCIGVISMKNNATKLQQQFCCIFTKTETGKVSRNLG